RSQATPMREQRNYTVTPLETGQPRRTIGPGTAQQTTASGGKSWANQPPDLGTPQPPPPLPPVGQTSQQAQTQQAAADMQPVTAPEPTASDRSSAQQQPAASVATTEAG